MSEEEFQLFYSLNHLPNANPFTAKVGTMVQYNGKPFKVTEVSSVNQPHPNNERPEIRMWSMTMECPATGEVQVFVNIMPAQCLENVKIDVRLKALIDA